MIAAFRLLALVLLGLSATMIAPGAIALGSGNLRVLEGFAFGAMGAGFVGGLLLLALRGRVERFDRVDMLKAALILWIVVPPFAAVPLASATSTHFDAWIEAVSAFTTTGSTVFETVGDLPMSIVLWRGMLQGLGGALTLIVLLLAIAPLALGGLPLKPVPLADSPGASIRDRFAAALRLVLPTYGGATLACFVALAMAGVPAIEALALAFATLSTGGMMPVDGGIATFGAPVIAPVLTIFLFIGATSFLWHRQVLRLDRGSHSRHREAAYIAGASLLVGGIALWVTIGRGPELGIGDALLVGTSLVSGTGIGPTPGAFGPLPVSLVILMVILGAGSFSPAGGLSFYRTGGMLVQSWRELLRLIHPHSMRPARIGGQIYDMQLMKAIWSALLVSIVTLAVIALAAAATGLPFEAALPFAATQLANAGPFYDPAALGIANVPPFHALPESSKLVAAIAMTIGRVEMLALLALVHLAYWRP